MFEKRDYVAKFGTWTDRISVDFLAMPLTEVLAKTPATPNQITILSFLVSLGSAGFFLMGGRTNLIWGAIIWHIATVLDGVDGMLARKTGQCSEFGAKLDTTLDKVKKIVNIVALFYSFRNSGYEIIIIALIIIHYLIRYFIRVKPNLKVQEFLHSKGLKAIFDPLDAQCFILFLGPITGQLYFFLVFTILLQLLDRTINFSFNTYKSHKG